MFHVPRTAHLIPLFCALMAWAIVASPGTANAHDTHAETSKLAAPDGPSSNAMPEDLPDTRHADGHHCHSAGPICHFFAVAYSGQTDWPLRNFRKIHVRGPVPFRDRHIIPLLRPPRYGRHAA